MGIGFTGLRGAGGNRFLFAAGLTETLVDGDGLIDKGIERGCASDNCDSILDIRVESLIKGRTLGTFIPIEWLNKGLEFGGVSSS